MTEKPRKSRSLLIVEDEVDLRNILIEICRELTDDIEIASHGAEALNKIQSRRFDSILSDLNMPTMNGLELLRKIREAGLDTPFIILTGYGDKQGAVEALRLGAMDFLDKPFDDQKLLETLDVALSLGYALNERDHELAQSFQALGLSDLQVEKLKKAHRTIWSMRKDSELRAKKKVNI